MDATTLTASPDKIDEYLSRAEDAWESGMILEAADAARQALDVCPSNANALHILGLAEFAAGDIDASIAHLRDACARPDAPGIFFRNLCEVYRQAGRLDEAESAGKQAVAIDNGLAVGWHSLASVYFNQERLDECQACAETAVRLAPQFAPAGNTLAAALYKQGRLESAKREAMRTLAVDPNSADAHATLTLVLAALGEYENAVEHARRAVEINPGLVGAYLGAAAVEAQLGRFDRLLCWAEQARAVAPRNIHVLLMHASALRRLERCAEALAACREALAIEPDSSEAYNILGLALQDLGRGEEALAAFEKAEALSGAPAEILNDRGMLLMELGRKPEAMAVLDHALTLRPDFAMALYNRSDLKKFTSGDPDIAHMESVLRGNPEPDYVDRIRLHFALGKAYLDTGDADAAFDHFARGNEMKRRTLAYDSAQSDHYMRSIASAVSREAIADLHGAGDPSTVPIFVLGMPRSGTTLVEQVLASHPSVFGAGERLFVEKLLFAAHLIGMSDAGPVCASKVPRELLPWLGREYVSLVTELAPGAPHVVDKMPANFLYAGYIHLMLPGAKIIHCRRNPADICLSCYTRLFSGKQDFAYDQVELGRFYLGYDALMAHWRAVLPSHSFLDVEYESMVGDLEVNARRLLEFCGLDWDDSCLRFHEQNRQVKTASMTQVRSPIYKTSVGRWEKYAKHLTALIDVLREIPDPLGA